MSKIEWTDATWNPVTGCTLKSRGCENCYAAREAAGRLRNHPAYRGLARRNAAGVAKFTGEVRLLPERLTQPLRWRKPRMVFVNSMSDLFHESIPDEYIDRVFAVMSMSPAHTFQVLTKRADRMRDYILRRVNGGGDPFAEAADWVADEIGLDYHPYVLEPDHLPLPNVWLGVSVEDADQLHRLDSLRATPAAVRFVSFEPLLGPLGDVDLTGIHQAICGGESGPKADPMHPDWPRSLRDRCAAAGVAFFHKQNGEWREAAESEIPERIDDPGCADFCTLCSNGFRGSLDLSSAFLHKPGRWPQCFPNGADGDASCETVFMRRVGKARAGRLLDGVLHDGYPEAAA